MMDQCVICCGQTLTASVLLVSSRMSTEDLTIDIRGWSLSPRGAGYLFGGDITKAFARTNAIDLIARAHQLAMEGYKLMFDKTIVTVWSAPNYCYRYVFTWDFVVARTTTHVHVADVEILRLY